MTTITPASVMAQMLKPHIRGMPLDVAAYCAVLAAIREAEQAASNDGEDAKATEGKVN